MVACLPPTRLCASVTGSCNLLFSVWLHGTQDISALETLLTAPAGPSGTSP